ncbi:MAG TPA: DNA primase large subunit PriL [Candidatus Bathyarchaeia archaeon]|nr:DNA primase large subunit PriL [Candidatus Bathyarchaeia archaeon]
MAKYPFLPEASEYVKSLDLQITELTDSTFSYILDRAENRVGSTLTSNNTGASLREFEVEIPSFPIAVMLVAAIKDPYLKKRYALLEAKRISASLNEEKKETITHIAEFFNWKIRALKKLEGEYHDFAIYFTDFLRNTSMFHEAEWKLINQRIIAGEILLRTDKVSRLLEEEVRRYIEKRLQAEDLPLPDALVARAERLKQLLMLKKGRLRKEEMPKQVIVAAFPPCVKALYTAIISGHHLSHVGRFTLTTFLVNIGVRPEEVIELYHSLSDFNERLTRYQVEHIAGARGSGTKYVPPRCDTLRTHGVCTGMDEICKKTRHPLGYYRRKLRQAQPTLAAPSAA